jgi:hypothetical protein
VQCCCCSLHYELVSRALVRHTDLQHLDISVPEDIPLAYPWRPCWQTCQVHSPP